MKYSFLKNVKRFELFFPSIIAIFFVIVIASNNTFFVEADRLLAQLVHDQYAAGHNYNVGVFNFINYYYNALYCIPLTLLAYIIVVEIVLYLKNRSTQAMRRMLTICLYIGIAGIVFRFIDCWFEYIMKDVLNRPRPRETIGLAKPETDPECLVTYTGFLEKFVGDNPCNRKFRSCPSGHTIEVSMMMIIGVYTVRYYERYCVIFAPTLVVEFNKVLEVIMIMLAVIFTPVVMVGRIIDFAHYFGDVTLGFGLAYVFTFLWGVCEPDWAEFDNVEKGLNLLEESV